MRIIAYGFIGLLFFSVVGLLVGRLADESGSVVFFTIFGTILVSGVGLCVLFAIWMGKRGEKRLISFSLRPKMEYGIYGAAFSVAGLIKFIQYMDPLNLHPLVLLLAWPAGILIGGPALLYYARKMDLPTVVTTRW